MESTKDNVAKSDNSLNHNTANQSLLSSLSLAEKCNNKNKSRKTFNSFLDKCQQIKRKTTFIIPQVS